MITKHKTDWSLLAKYLAGETREEENAAMDKWLNNSPENRALFGKLKSDWKIMDTMNKQFNVDNAWNKLYGRINKQGTSAGNDDRKSVSTGHRRLGLSPIRIAASLLFLTVLGVSLLFVAGKFQKVTVSTSSNDRQRSVILPDGSTVVLNANTRLSYLKKFSRGTREVTLSGEAFFEVTPDKSRPFLIHADNADIKVVGTSFNIDTRDKDLGVEVYVSTGIVDLYQPDNESNHVLLHPGDLGTISKNRINNKKCANENPIAWKTGNMDFQDTRLPEAVRVLNEIYRVNIVYQESGLDTIPTNGTYRYPDDPLDHILTIFCLQYHLKIEKSDNKIYLTR